jgi:hypothetical protein
MRLGSLVFSTVLLTTALAAAPGAAADAAARPVPVEGRVVDRQGDPVRGATVVAVDVQDRSRQLIAKTSADGRFEATLAPKGRFYVEVCEGSGRAGCAALPSLLPVYVGPDERAVTPLLLTSSFPRSGRRIDLGRVALRHRAARITVTVDAGRPSVVHILGAEPRGRVVVPERPWATLDGRRSGGVRRIGGLVPTTCSSRPTGAPSARRRSTSS